MLDVSVRTISRIRTFFNRTESQPECENSPTPTYYVVFYFIFIFMGSSGQEGLSQAARLPN